MIRVIRVVVAWGIGCAVVAVVLKRLWSGKIPGLAEKTINRMRFSGF